MRIILPKKIPATYIAGLVDVLNDLGVDKEAFLLRENISANEIASPDSHFERPHYLSVVQAALNISDCEDLGFRVGKHPACLEQSAICQALLSCTTFVESLTRYQRYQQLLGSALTTRFTVNGELAKITVKPRERKLILSEAQTRYLTQQWLAGWNLWMPVLGMTGGFFEHVSLGYRADGNPEVYAQHLNCGVSFGQKQTEAVFPASYLERKLQLTPDVIKTLCTTHLDGLYTSQGIVQKSIIIDIHNRLSHSPACIPSMREMSSSLHLSPRTLRRRLLKENKTYQQLIIDFRMATAQQYLQSTDLPANEISTLAGYADTANFYRTFRKQNDMTPAAFRQLHSQPDQLDTA